MNNYKLRHGRVRIPYVCSEKSFWVSAREVKEIRQGYKCYLSLKLNEEYFLVVEKAEGTHGTDLEHDIYVLKAVSNDNGIEVIRTYWKESPYVESSTKVIGPIDRKRLMNLLFGKESDELNKIIIFNKKVEFVRGNPKYQSRNFFDFERLLLPKLRESKSKRANIDVESENCLFDRIEKINGTLRKLEKRGKREAKIREIIDNLKSERRAIVEQLADRGNLISSLEGGQRAFWMFNRDNQPIMIIGMNSNDIIIEEFNICYSDGEFFLQISRKLLLYNF